MSVDAVICGLDRALRTLSGGHRSTRPNPAKALDHMFDPSDRARAAALMRVNHSGEICAQALYQAQSMFARSPGVAQALKSAAAEEEDHLRWTVDRITELGGRRSLLDPLWYAGAFAIGVLAARTGDAGNLGFLKETERQVVAHLKGHLDRLPESDERSRQILRQMCSDEASHADLAAALGGVEFSPLMKAMMKTSATVMTSSAYWV